MPVGKADECLTPTQDADFDVQLVEFDQPNELMPMARRSGRGIQMLKGEDVGVCSAETLCVHQAQQQGTHDSSKDYQLAYKLDEERA